MEFIEVLKVILLGIVEGITEWLPVSSTGHMLLVDAIPTLTLQATDAFKEMLFVVIQLGAILAVLVLFWNKLFPWKKERIAVNPDEPSGVKTRIATDKGILNLWGKVLVACLPAGVIGILFDDILEEYLHTPLVISLTLILYGVAFIVVENLNKNKELPLKTTAEISYKHALIIGAFQVLSLIPGTSRSGATILGALLVGIARPAGAEFTFFLAIPVMAGASAIKLLKFFMESGGFTGAEIGYLLIGAIVAFAVSMLAIKFLMKFVQKHDFKAFGWYRIALGAIVIATLVIPPFFA
ncbi:MAG: undecaprenyl-diphosphate phosphatase [Clostridia bacterium]|nr:undecaprenyl-diphosphate phosphatase [Clostridia bacterium]